MSVVLVSSNGRSKWFLIATLMEVYGKSSWFVAEWLLHIVGGHEPSQPTNLLFADSTSVLSLISLESKKM